MTHNSTALTDLAGTGAAPGAPYLDFGARLYSPGTATWLSVDPMAEKYYGIGPLTYCAANPVNLVDPTGRIIVVRDSSEGLATEYEWQEVGETWGFYDVDGKAYSGSNEYILSLTDALSTLMEEKAGSDLIQEIVGYKDDKVYIGENANPRNKGKNNYYPNTKTVAWNSKNSKIDSPFLSLGHELAHALSDLRGNRNSDLWIPKGEEGAITAIIDAYSSMGELHLDIVSGIVQHSFEHAYPGIDIERVIRNDPKCFFSIYDLYGVSDFTDGSDDRSIRIEIMNGRIVSSVAYQYSLFIDELAKQRISRLLK